MLMLHLVYTKISQAAHYPFEIQGTSVYFKDYIYYDPAYDDQNRIYTNGYPLQVERLLGNLILMIQ